jgi:uncharacterized protein
MKRILFVLQGSVKKTIFVLTALLSVFAAYFALRVKFNYDFDQFYPKNKAELAIYESYTHTFGADDDFMVLIAENPKGTALDKDFLQSLRVYLDSLKNFKEIVNVQSLVTSEVYVQDPLLGDVYSYPMLDLQADSIKATDVLKYPLANDVFLAQDLKSTQIIFSHASHWNDKEKGLFLEKLYGAEAYFNTDVKFHYAGKIFAQNFYITLMQRETLLFVGSSVLLIVIFLWFSFKNFWGILLPLGIVGIALLWVLGIMGFLGLDLNIILNLLPTMLLVVGVSGGVHFMAKYLLHQSHCKTELSALEKTLQELGFALFFTSFTTILGFATLATSSITPIIHFGLCTALGVFLTYILNITLLPNILGSIGLRKKHETQEDFKFWRKVLGYTFDHVLPYRKTILIGTLVIFVLSIWGLAKIKTNNYLIEDLKDNHPIKQTYKLLEDQYSGGRPLDILIHCKKDKTVFDEAFLHKIDTLQSFLKTSYHSKQIFSLVNLLKESAVTANQGDYSFYTLPSDKELKKTSKLLKKYKEKSKLYEWVDTTNYQSMRIQGTMHDIGGYQAKIKRKEIFDFLAKIDPEKDIDLHFTGGPYLMEINNDLLTSNVLQGMLIAFLLMGAVMGYLYKSWRMAFLSLLPNALPIFMVAGIMGFWGIDLKMSTSLVFTIAFGIAVDDTIHFLGHFKLNYARYQKNEISFAEALKNTYIYTGKAIIISSMILSGGFLTLAFSDFLGTFYIGVLISLTLLFALLADLILLPVLLYAFYHKPIK